ncbi:MAG: 50S ribosomal protein L22 [Candidatus Zambryskibacteria bacterium]|nr:50S ribosomal protein L22 [Candidatus Zambryskibacteria bacterium]
MTEAKAHLKNYRQSPRKVRLVAGAVRGKSIAEAIDILSFVPNRAALPLQKLLASALANAKSQNIATENLTIKSLMVDEGPTLYRRRPRSRGMANPIRKRTSHVTVVVTEGVPKKSKKAKSSKLTANS